MSETSNRQIRKFNPGTFQSDEELMEQFVVRNREHEIALEVLRANIDSPSCQHVLVIAPRGRGKTMLLARAAAEIRVNDDLARCLLPVRFMEESQEIFHMGDFWLEALFHLARESAPHDSELAQELRTTHADLSAHWGDRSLEDRARAAVLGAADRLDKKLVLMVENLQSICESVDADFGWKLRGALQSEPKIILLASATSRFEGLDEAEQPFFELFRNICLEPLTTEECRLLWQAVSGDEVSGREIRPLQILTGGSPRLLVIVAGFARHHSLRQLMEELVTLIDEHTEYFRSHLEVLAKTERRVYLAVIDLWRPSSTAEIAARARMDVRAVSTMLGRLVERGAVIVEGSGRKRLYAAAERLYSIYYKLRRERDEAAIVENLIRFMVVFYDEEEQAEMIHGLIWEAMESTTIREGLDRAAAKIPEFDRLYSNITLGSLVDSGSSQLSAINGGWEHLLQGITAALNKGEFKKVLKTANRLGRLFQGIASVITESELGKHIMTANRVLAPYATLFSQFLQPLDAVLLNVKANAHRKCGEFDEAIAAYENVIVRYGDSNIAEIQQYVAMALFRKGSTLEELGNFGASIMACEEVVKRFGDSDEPEIQWWVASALINKSIKQTQTGDADAVLNTCAELERRLVNFDREMKHWFVWRTMCVRTKALLLKENLQDAMDAFGSAYAALPTNTEFTMPEMLKLIADLIAAGASSHELLEILTSDEAKSSALTPLIVALRQHTGETVRAPAEVLEVAADILERIKEQAAKGISGASRPLE